MDYVALGKRVRAQRKLLRMTQEELSEKAGISLSFLGHIERGTRKASVETLVSLSNALNVSTDMLLQDSLAKSAPGSINSPFSSNVQTLLKELATALREE